MTIKSYLLILTICSIACWIAWLLVLFLIDPSVSLLGVVIFYLTLGFALIGTFSVGGYFLREKFFHKNELTYKKINIASRHSVLFAILIIIALILQSQRYLSWWNLLILITVIGFIEIFLASYKKIKR